MLPSIEYKVRKVLLLFAFLLLCIFLRVWFLSVINYDKMQKLSVLPRRRTHVLAPSRGIICDKEGKILACNQKQFDVAICYQDIKEIPQVEVQFINGKKERVFKRKAYVKKLSSMLSEILSLSEEEIEDFIYAKAAIFQDMPMILKSDIMEGLYPVLKMKEKDWPGLKILVNKKRSYPQGKLACHIVGYIGPIDSKTYQKLQEEKTVLKKYVEEREKGLTPELPKGFMSPFEVRERYDLLCMQSYKLQDLIGKEGIEKSFDSKLRGSPGKIKSEVTRLGETLSILPGSYEKQKPAKIELAIDLDLQKKAEELLAKRETNDEFFPKGGAVCVLDLKTNQVLALASYPRFNPQDFVEKNSEKIHQWTESPQYIQKLFEGTLDFEKEQHKNNEGFFIKKTRLSFPYFLKRLLSSKSSARKLIEKELDAKEAFEALDAFKKLHEKWGFIEPQEVIKEIKSSKNWDDEEKALIEPLQKIINRNEDPILTLDIIKLLIDPERIDHLCLQKLEKINLCQFFYLYQEYNNLSEVTKEAIKRPFEMTLFEDWKKNHFKAFLKLKRQEEVEKKTYARPYTEYLEKEKNRQFNLFFQKYKKLFIAKALEKVPNLSKELKIFEACVPLIQESASCSHLSKAFKNFTLEETASFLRAFRPFHELNKPLYGSYKRFLDSKSSLEKDLALSFYPKYKLGYLRSNAYRELAPQGSVFKVVVAYEALKEKIEGQVKKLPFLIDQLMDPGKNKKDQILGFDENRNPIRRWHKGGLLPRSSHAGIGGVDIVSALEQSSNIYFSLLASETILSPAHLLEAARKFGLGQKTGIDLPYEAKGKLPNDLNSNKTGLYAFAIGQHELLVTPLQTACMMGGLFLDGKIFKPQITRNIIEEKISTSDLFSRADDGPYSETLGNLGCFFPLFTENMKSQKDVTSAKQKDRLLQDFPVNPMILDPIKKGLDRVVWGDKGTARPIAIASFLSPQEMKSYLNLKHMMIGKTGTAEQKVIETLDSEAESRMMNHIWFGALSFSDSSQKNPELALCVYLKDGKIGGKEAAPIAAKLIEAYKKKYEQSN